MTNEHTMRQAQMIRIMMAVITKIARQDIEQRLSEHAVNIGSLPFGVLHVIHRRKAETLKELSQIMMLSPATLVPAVDTLEREGLVIRRKDPNDRRRTPITLTDKGQELIQRIPPMREGEHFLSAIQGLGSEERSELLRLLKTIIRRLPDGEAMVEEMERDVTVKG
jgi:DNA-binding MarR family transcriptional regulator